MFYGFLGLIAFAIWRSIDNWREGMFWLVVIAAVQDPVRKLVPGAPVTITLMVTLVQLTMAFTLLLSHTSWWQDFRGVFPNVARWMSWLVIACMPAAAISATYGPGSWILTVLGAVSYGLLFAMIFVGFYWPTSVVSIRRLLGSYCILSSVMLSGTLIEYLGLFPDLPILGTKALEADWVRYSGTDVLELIAGFYRSPDVMGWHAATTAIFAIILAMTARLKARWWWLALTLLPIAALFVSGRRKMVYMLPVFAVVMLLTYWRAGRTTKIVGFAAVLAVPLLGILMTSNWLGADSPFINYYGGNLGDVSDQLEGHSFRALVTTVQQSGFFGAGLGVAAPGSHTFSNIARPRVWQESGPSRVMVELGVPGFTVMVCTILALIRTAWSAVLKHVKANTPYAPYAASLLAFFLANLGSLLVSGQILADPFISAFVGITIGLVLSLVRVPAEVLQASYPTLFDRNYPTLEPTSDDWGSHSF
jgi:hypothetical protein